MHTGRERGYILPLERVYFDLEGTKASRSKWERWNLASALFFSLHFVGGLSIDKLRQSCRLLETDVGIEQLNSGHFMLGVQLLHCEFGPIP